MVTTTRARVAAAVAAVRQIDAERGTDTAIADVAETLHLDPTDVAQIACDESHADALREEQRRGIAAVGARSMGVALELADAPGCRGCGACSYDRASAACDPLDGVELGVLAY